MCDDPDHLLQMPTDRPPRFIEVRLSWLLAKSGITQPRPDRRLSAVENLLSALAQRWGGSMLLVPEREVQMAEGTRDELLSWVEASEEANDHTRTRIAIYASGALIEDSVPDGWIRQSIMDLSSQCRTRMVR